MNSGVFCPSSHHWMVITFSLLVEHIIWSHIWPMMSILFTFILACFLVSPWQCLIHSSTPGLAQYWSSHSNSLTLKFAYCNFFFFFYYLHGKDFIWIGLFYYLLTSQFNLNKHICRNLAWLLAPLWCMCRRYRLGADTIACNVLLFIHTLHPALVLAKKQLSAARDKADKSGESESWRMFE